ncbi:MAG: RHS repeat protein, partial [Planctomycetaceae bacterium]|nr:RHS repeat protein [Planctomycetaceae bacterium]
DDARLTLDSSKAVTGFWASSAPDGFSTTVQIRGSGAVAGILQPGEHLRVPVYYVGLGQPWDMNDWSVNFSLEVLNDDSEVLIDWEQIKALRPPTISPQAWDVIHANLQVQVGDTWGDYTRTLNENAAYLGQLGQHVVDDGELWSFEVLQASGLSPVSNLSAVSDAYVAAPGLPITFGRVYSPGISDRFELGVLGRGWSWTGGWLRLLTVETDGKVIISDQCGCGSNASKGSQRIFEPDRRHPGKYLSQSGDNATLTSLAGGLYELREANGIVTRFRGDGRVDFVQDTNSNRITTTWASGQLTRLTHSAGQFLQVGYNAAGRIATLLDSNGRTVSYAYDATGEHLTSVTGNDGEMTRYTYSTGAGAAREHALVSIEFPDGTSEFFTYDARGRLASIALDAGAQPILFTYDTVGRVAASDAVGATTSYFFDHLGRVASFQDALGHRTLLDFDGRNLSGVTDALGQNYTFSYDTRGNMIRSTDPLGQSTTFSYTTDFNRLASVTDARGNPLKYGYDSRGNLTSITYADNSAERFSVDTQGNLDTYTNRRGQLVDASYDAAGRLLRQDFPDGSFVQYLYNSLGNLVQTIDQDGVTQIDYLDPAHQDLPTTITYPNGRALQYTYEHGRRTSLVHPDGFTVHYLYDAFGRLESLRDGDNQLIVQYQYDVTGRLARRTNGNGTFTEYVYDAAGQVLNLINRAPDGSVNSRFDYVYDPLGRRTRMTTLEGVWNYTYDATGQLTRAVFASNDPGAIPHQDLQYVYDAVGNRIRTIINGVTTEYTTNNLNQYVQVGTAQYTYDRDGNLTARVDGGVTETFTYNSVNRLVGVATPDGTWDYEYDAFSNRSATVHNSLRTEFLVDPFGLGDVVAEFESGTTLGARYVHAFSTLVNQINGHGATYYYDFDAIGSTVGMTSGTGSYVNQYRYLPFGERFDTGALIQNPLTMSGAFGVISDTNGLVSMRSRFYESTTGRFVSADPIGTNGGDVNLYRYASNNPVSFVDPVGLASIEVGGFASLFGRGIGGSFQLGTCGISITGAAGQGAGGSIGLGLNSADPGRSGSRRIAGGTAQGGVGPGGLSVSVDDKGNVDYGGSFGVGAGVLVGGYVGREWKFPWCDISTTKCTVWFEGKKDPVDIACQYVQHLLPPEPPRGNRVQSVDVPIPAPGDPNEKTGPFGFGPAGFIAPNTLLPYRVDF